MGDLYIYMKLHIYVYEAFFFCIISVYGPILTSIKKQLHKLQKEVGMVMPKSTQTRVSREDNKYEGPLYIFFLFY